jgi:hypothetical protein
MRVQPDTTYTRTFTIKNADAVNLLTFSQPYFQPTGSGSDPLLPFFSATPLTVTLLAHGESTSFTVSYYMPPDAVTGRLFNTLVEVMVPSNDPTYTGVSNDYGFKLGIEGFDTVPAIGDVHVELLGVPIFKVNKKGKVSISFSAQVSNPTAIAANPAYYGAFISDTSDLVIPAEPVRAKVLKKPFPSTLPGGASPKTMKFKLKNLPPTGFIYFAGVPSGDANFGDNWFVLPFGVI